MTFTKQLQALELEEIPDNFIIGRTERRWLLPTILAVSCVTIGVVIGIFLFTAEGVPTRTTLKINSIPGGASVKINDLAVAEVTPIEWSSAEPGARYVIVLERQGYETETREVTVSADGGDITVILERVPVTLEVDSTPQGAEIYLNGQFKGRTPKTLTGLDVNKSRELELILSGYQPHMETLSWEDKDILQRNIDLHKAPRSP
ncbi:MAG: PEGA domain-containing protein [Proteobacteria bacterium]|nr:PEGA domain-containing protein [Pseudomonadota bacterium]